uniref:scavenger receptor cysteine-rich type 1 protein M130-like n=1 Tax=Semicossyphus pulcher TaxID=241346 RepID=UPI0037E7545E
MLSMQHSFFFRWSLVVVWCFVGLTEYSSLQPEDNHPSQSAVNTDARLVDGGSRCSGRLEMKNQGEWRTLERNNIKYAKVACRQMGCGSAVSLTHSTNNTTERPAWDVNFSCRGTEFTLKDCKDPKRRGQVLRKDASTSSLQVICSESVRLVGESYMCHGGVEVKTDQGWAAVCEDGFDSEAKKLFCRELGCGPPRHLGGSFIKGEEPALSKQFQCKGNESRLEDCASSFRKDCKPADGISCTSEIVVRLSGGESPCKGTVEGRQNGEWRPVVDGWTILIQEYFKDVCGKLGCGSFMSMSRSYLPKRQAAWELSTDCRDRGSSFCTLWEEASSDTVITAACSEAVRLVKGPDRCSGKLEVKSGQSWVPVCSSYFTIEAALVTCRELECGFPENHYGRHSGLFLQNTGSIPSPVFNCSGTEKHLIDCPSTSVNTTEQDLSECAEAYVVCKEQPPQPSITVYTMQGPDFNKPQVFKGHHFAIQCSIHSPFSILSVRLKSHVYTRNPLEQIQAPVDGQAIFFFPAAEDSHQGRYQCDYNFNFSSEVFSKPQFISVTVKELNDVRLVSELSRCAGRLELEHQKEWRPVSFRHSWRLKEEAVVCRQLNCGAAVSTRKVDGAAELLPVWHFYSDCVGSERALMDCGMVKKRLSSSTVEVVCSDVLLPPKKPVFSVMSDRRSADQEQEVLIFKGHSFTVSCSVEPQHPGSHFSLNFTGLNQTNSITQPAVNHSAHFLFTAADESNRGNYSCVYHNFVFNHNFSSESQSLSLNLYEYLDLMLDDGVIRDDDSEACAGRLLVSQGGKFMQLSADSTVWDLKHASVVCRQLGCGSAVSTKGVILPQKTMIARLFSDCDGSESALLDCGTVLPWFSSSAVEVICTGHEVEAGKI